MFRNRADYLVVRGKSRKLAALWCAAALAGYMGLIGGVIALAFPLLHRSAEWLRSQPGAGFKDTLWISGGWFLSCCMLVVASVTLKTHVRKRAGTYDRPDR